jgi:hypothetical protein
VHMGSARGRREALWVWAEEWHHLSCLYRGSVWFLHVLRTEWMRATEVGARRSERNLFLQVKLERMQASTLVTGDVIWQELLAVRLHVETDPQNSYWFGCGMSVRSKAYLGCFPEHRADWNWYQVIWRGFTSGAAIRNSVLHMLT